MTAPQAPPKAGREPLHLALVLDRSGSMGGPKIALAREAVRQALQALRPADRFSLIVYDEEVTAVVESAKATAEARRNATAKLARIDARGSTDLHGGWRAGCDQLAAHLGATDVGRCLLLTDGQANVGIVDPGEMAGQAGAARKGQRIATSTFGVGDDFDERLLHGMADASGGRFYFIGQPAQILDLLTSELGELLQVVARDACLTLQVPKGIEAAPLNALGTAAVTGGIQIRLGDLRLGPAARPRRRAHVPGGARRRHDCGAVQPLGSRRRAGRAAANLRLELRHRPRPAGPGPRGHRRPRSRRALRRPRSRRGPGTESRGQ